MIFDHTSSLYVERRKKSQFNQFNGAYYYSKEIVKNIIPRVRTDRNWVTIYAEGQCFDHSIVFIHNNINTEQYYWLKQFKDLVLVVGVPQTVEKVQRYADHVVYLPLSVDVEDVEKYKRLKRRYQAYVGRRDKMAGLELPFPCDLITDMPREELLPAMAEYERVYAVGRCAIEAKVLGCNIGVYDYRYPDPELWQVVDNKEAAKMLQKELDKIDKLK